MTRLRERVIAKSKNPDQPSIVQQQHKNAVNINTIMANLVKNGVAPQQITRSYGDIVDAPELSQALDVVIHAQNSFDSLPISVKKIIDNDWTRYEELFSSEENLKILAKNGLVTLEEDANQGGNANAGSANATPPTDPASNPT